jgi:hypothetical protein
MSKKLLLFILFLVAVSGLILFSGQADANWNSGLRIITEQSELPDETADIVLINIMMWVLRIFIPLAIISFVATGIMYLFAGSNAQLAEKAKKGVWFSIIGVAVGLIALIVIQLFLNLYQGEGEFGDGSGGVSDNGGYGIDFGNPDNGLNTGPGGIGNDSTGDMGGNMDDGSATGGGGPADLPN